MPNYLKNDSVVSKNLSVDLRRKLVGDGSNSVIFAQTDSKDFIEIPVCSFVSLSNITSLSGVQIINGVDTSEHKFGLVNGQNDATENGIYILSNGAWQHWQDAQPSGLCCVAFDSVNSQTLWQNENDTFDFGVTNISYKLVGGGGASIPDGIVDGSILRWNDTLKDWEVTSLTTVKDSFILLVYPRTGGELGDGSIYLDAAGGYMQMLHPAAIGNNFVGLTAGAKYAQLQLHAGQPASQSNHNVTIRSNLKVSDGNIMHAVVENATRFVIAGNGTIMSNSLTADTLLMANASKEIISIADGTNGQVLTTDGAGTYSWQNAGGGGASKFVDTITGDGATSLFTIIHNKNDIDVIVQIYDFGTGETVLAPTKRIDADTVEIEFNADVPNLKKYKVVIL